MYIVQRTNKSNSRTSYVVARPGYYRSNDGIQVRSADAVGPEWDDKLEHAYMFATHRAAARVCNMCHQVEIIEVS